jgi:hypothetical protein
MTQPATGETTPTTKRKRDNASAAPVTPGNSVLYLTAALQAAKDADAAREAASSHPMDSENEDDPPSDSDDEEELDNQPEPVPLRCSMPSLPPAFTSFADTISKKVSAFMMSKRAKLRVITKLEIREIIPTPIRFKFDLSGSKEVTGNDEFFGLAAACSMAIQTCQADLKVQMVMAARMEIDVIDQKSREIFYQALQGFAQLILIESATGPVLPTDAQVRMLALSTLDRNIGHFTEPHNFDLNQVSLFSEYKTVTNDALPIWTLGCADDTYCTDHAADITKLTSLMYETIAQRWLDKLSAMNEKEKAALLEATQRSFFQTESTREAAEALALEKSMEETRMDGVIANKIAIENKALHAKISNLESMIRRSTISGDIKPKNSRGGANSARASKKKPNQRKKAPTTDASNQKQPANSNSRKPAEAAASANATWRKGTATKSKKKTKRQNGNNGKKSVGFKS